VSLPHDTSAASAESRANRKFARARRRTRKQKISHVRARDEQHHGDRTQQEQKLAAYIADKWLLGREDFGSQPLLGLGIEAINRQTEESSQNRKKDIYLASGPTHCWSRKLWSEGEASAWFT
jgi:hypothetical protein